MEKTPSQHAREYIGDSFQRQDEEQMREIAWKFVFGQSILKAMEESLETVPENVTVRQIRWGVDEITLEFGKFRMVIQQQIT